jgi:1-acyl-sn-glycerol-3-phosphate acyltransferase
MNVFPVDANGPDPATRQDPAPPPVGYRRTRVRLLRTVLRPLYRLILDLEVVGAERIPRSGPCLLVFNHLSNLDAHLLLTLMPRDDATGLVAADYRRRPLHRWIVEAGGGSWLRRGEGDRDALRRALGLLGEGWLVGLAPEGGRSPDGKLRPAKPGAAFLALRSGAPVLPVGVDGTDRFAGRIRRGRRTPVRIVIGEPFVLEAPPGQGRREAIDLGTARIMGRISGLIPPWRIGPPGAPPPATGGPPSRSV